MDADFHAPHFAQGLRGEYARRAECGRGRGRNDAGSELPVSSGRAGRVGGHPDGGTAGAECGDHCGGAGAAGLAAGRRGALPRQTAQRAGRNRSGAQGGSRAAIRAQPGAQEAGARGRRGGAQPRARTGGQAGLADEGVRVPDARERARRRGSRGSAEVIQRSGAAHAAAAARIPGELQSNRRCASHGRGPGRRQRAAACVAAHRARRSRAHQVNGQNWNRAARSGEGSL